MWDSQLLAFAGIALLVTLSPGQDTLLVIRNTLAGEFRAGFASVVGIMTGLAVHALLAALGLTLILVRSAQAFAIVKLVGAAYLTYLGVQSLRSAWRARSSVAARRGPVPQTASAAISRRRAWAQGVLTNALNPKVALFYLAFLPQFIRPGDNVALKSLLLVGLHAAMGLVWLTVVARTVTRTAAWLAQPTLKRRLDFAIGALFTALGIRLAIERA
ncbi:MAG TPA: LysE family translocator [Steroidobacteraceae bacterium]